MGRLGCLALLLSALGGLRATGINPLMREAWDRSYENMGEEGGAMVVESCQDPRSEDCEGFCWQGSMKFMKGCVQPVLTESNTVLTPLSFKVHPGERCMDRGFISDSTSITHQMSDLVHVYATYEGHGENELGSLDTNMREFLKKNPKCSSLGDLAKFEEADEELAEAGKDTSHPQEQMFPWSTFWTNFLLASQELAKSKTFPRYKKVMSAAKKLAWKDLELAGPGVKEKYDETMEKVEEARQQMMKNAFDLSTGPMMNPNTVSNIMKLTTAYHALQARYKGANTMLMSRDDVLPSVRRKLEARLDHISKLQEKIEGTIRSLSGRDKTGVPAHFSVKGSTDEMEEEENFREKGSANAKDDTKSKVHPLSGRASKFPAPSGAGR